MYEIVVKKYWNVIKNYYYDTGIQDHRGISIWRWLEEDFNAKRRKVGKHTIFSDYLQFEHKEDMMLFIVRWS